MFPGWLSRSNIWFGGFITIENDLYPEYRSLDGLSFFTFFQWKLINQPGVFASAYPYWHSLGVPPSTSEEEVIRLAKHQLDMMLRQQVAPQDTAAIIIEPVQGEG